MSTGEQYSTTEIIAALNKCRGAIFLAADEIGCSYKTIERRAAKVQAVQDVIDKYRGRRVDRAELALDSALIKEEPWAIMFTLKTQGKHRGYVERWENTGKDGGPIETKDVTLSDDERVERIASLLDTARARKAGSAVSDPAGEVQE